MALPTSGNITIAMIAAELGVGLPLDLNASNVRELAGKPTGSVIMPTDFYGKSSASAGPITINTNDPTGSGFTTHQISGYTGTRSLCVERYGYSGDTTFSPLTVTASTGASKTGPWTVRGSFNPMLSGLQYVDFSASTGQWIKYEVNAGTPAGRKQGSFSMVIWDLTAGVQISPDKPVSVIVDADNNYIPPRSISISGNVRPQRQFGNTWYDTGIFSVSVSDGATPTSYQWGGDLFGTGATSTFSGPSYNINNMTMTQSGYATVSVVIAGQTYTAEQWFSYQIPGDM